MKADFSPQNDFSITKKAENLSEAVIVLVPVNTDDKWSPARGSGGPEMPYYEVPAPSLPQLAGRVLGTRETFGRSGLLCTHLHVYNKPSTQC